MATTTKNGAKTTGSNTRTTAAQKKTVTKTAAKKTTKKKKATVTPFGTFGKLISFSVSGTKMLTFSELKHESEARWKEHALIGRKPRKQFLGPDTETITFDMILDARHGVKPLKTLSDIAAYRDKGKSDYLIINGTKVCANKMTIIKTSQTWDEVWNKGELVKATISVTLEECVR